MVVLDGIANGRQPSELLVVVTRAGVVAAAVVFGGGFEVLPVPVPDVVPPVEVPPVGLLPPVDPVVEPVEPVEPVDVPPFGGVVVPPLVEPVAGGVVVPPEVAPVAGGVVVPLLVDPVVAVSVVEPAEFAELLEPHALSARLTSAIAARVETCRFESKIIATCSHSLTCDRRGMQVTRHN
jgi:hypothetical protein